MTDQTETATSRLELVVGRAGLARLAASTVLVFGAGGVGSNCIEALARGGVGKLVVIDPDLVQESNINRQAIAFHSTVGRPKVDVVRSMVADINPDAEVVPVQAFVREEDVAGIFDAYGERLDYVVDAIDTVSTKLAIAQIAEERSIRLVSSMGGASRLHPELFRFADLYETSVCPLCRVMRREARRRGIGHLRVLYSTEQPVSPPTDVAGADKGEGVGARPTLGTASFVPPVMGQMIAGTVIRELAGLA